MEVLRTTDVRKYQWARGSAINELLSVERNGINFADPGRTSSTEFDLSRAIRVTRPYTLSIRAYI